MELFYKAFDVIGLSLCMFLVSVLFEKLWYKYFKVGKGDKKDVTKRS